jgi:hypothetical protein
VSRAAASVILLVLATVVATTGPARAVQEQPEPTPAQVLIDRLEPLVPGPGGTLVLAGRVHNTTREPLTDVTVRLRVSRLPLTGRGDVETIAEGSSGGRDGRSVPGTQVTLGRVAAGAESGFSITVPLDELRLPSYGVYVVGAEARGDSADLNGRLGITRTFLPWVPPDSHLQPTRLTWLLPLVDVPHRLANGDFTDDRLAQAFSPTGRLSRLLDAGAVAGAVPIAWLVDPMLLEDAAAMADGYRVRTGPGKTVPGAAAAAADSWLERLRTVTAGADVVALPYADADVTALQRARMGAQITAAARRGASVATAILDRPVTSDLTLPPAADLDIATARTLYGTGIATLALSDLALPTKDELTYTPTARATLALGGGQTSQVLLVDSSLTLSLEAGGRDDGERVLTRQRFLAETAMITAQRPADARYVLAFPPRYWDPPAAMLSSLLNATGAVPWMQPATLSDLRAQPVPDVRRDPLRYPAAARARELPATSLARVRVVEAEVDRFGAVLSEPRRVLPSYEAMLGRLLSAGWRGRDRAHGEAITDTHAGIEGQRARVRVLNGSVTLGSQSGTFPVTVANDLAQPVQVRLMLRAQSPRLAVTQPEPFDVGAHRKKQVLVPAKAVADGLVVVDAELQTPDGARYAAPVEIRVRVTEYGTVGLWITVGAAAVLFGAAGLRLIRRARGRHVAGS